MCGKVKVPPGKISQIVFSLAWDVPIVRFNSGAGFLFIYLFIIYFLICDSFSSFFFFSFHLFLIGFQNSYFRRYTNFYGRTGQNAPLIATDGLSDFRDWVNQIEKWQTPILQDSNLPDWYKQVNIYFFSFFSFSNGS